MGDMKPFWIVWRDNGPDDPIVVRARCTSPEQAEAEAFKVAEKFPGQRVYVAQTLASCIELGVQWDRATERAPAESKPKPKEEAKAVRQSVKNGAGKVDPTAKEVATK